MNNAHSTSNMMTLAQAAGWVADAHLQGEPTTGIRRVHTDTRSLQPGDLFVALQGERFNGNEFLAQAKSKGAAAALCSDAAALTESGLPGLVVDNSTLALGQLATGWRKQFKLALIAVTGSNGKTTVTQMIAAVLRAGKPNASLATEGNFNNDIGVPLTLLRLRAHHEVAVVELGMNHPGEIAHLAAMAQPTVALVNNAQREHQEFMATLEAVAQENGSVIDALPAAGIAVFPADEPYTAYWQTRAGTRRTLTFSLNNTSHAESAIFCEPSKLPEWTGSGWHLRVNTPQGLVSYPLRIAGLHNVKNSLAAVACSMAVGMAVEDIARGLAEFEPVKGRSRTQRLVLGKHAITLIDDTYNANPDSVRAAIDVLADLPGPRLLVLGDMGEVGDQGPAFHAEAGTYARQKNIEKLFCTGAQSMFCASDFGAGQHFPGIDPLIQAVLRDLPTVASVLVKGSRFMKMERVVQAINDQSLLGQEEQHAA